MRTPFSHSFRKRLFAGFLVVSLIPLLVCSTMLLQIFRLRLTEDAEEGAREHLTNAAQTIDALYGSFAKVATSLQGSALLTDALTVDADENPQSLLVAIEDTRVYGELFAATEGLRGSARFDLYDSEGRWRYSTESAPTQVSLPTDWGVLYAARQEGALTFSATEDATAVELPLLCGAVALPGGEGEPVGYLVISLYQSHLRGLLDGKYGAQNDLILLNRYWRPIYCAEPALAASLGPRLRGELLAGDPLGGAAEDFLYSVEYHTPTGIYMVLQRPLVFNRDTMRLLYTVSLSSALICVVISVAMSLKVSRQMFHPVERLQRAIGEVGQNNLDVYVHHGEDDELGQLAGQFNGMVAALRRNQEQLVENQRELNAAQIRMLQAQLNPHFLCNTLDTIKWTSKINQVPQVALMATDLADILRFCISPDELVPLWRETEILGRYIEIQKIRLSDFTFEVTLPLELEDCLVPKMMLQPLVENAILHGLDGVEDGAVRVEAQSTAEGMLRITVTDNGHGLPPDMTGSYADRAREQLRGHLGLYNVDTILQKYYGKSSGLYLDNQAGGRGAVVTATLPIQKEETEC